MLRLAEDLVRLRRGKTLTLMNGRYPRPLVFRKGCEDVERALAEPHDVVDHALRELLVRFRILVEDCDDPVPRTHQQFKPDLKDEFALYLLMTQRCNLSCVYCLGRNPSYLGKETMSATVALAAIRSAAETLRPGSELQLIYFGGEPLLNWDLVKECIRFVECELKPVFQLKFRHHVTTNLTTLPKDFIKLAQLYKITLLVDVDGTEAIHAQMRPFHDGRSSYSRVVDNLKKLKEAGIYFEMRATVTSHNVDSIREIMKHHKQFEPEACSFPTLTPVDSVGVPLDAAMYPDPEIYRQGMIEAVSDGLFDLGSLGPTNVIASRVLGGEFVVYGCGMLLGNTGVVDHSGDVYPCIYFVGQREFVFGNVASKGNPLSQESYMRFFERYRETAHVDHNAECSGCAVRYICGGGCPVRLLSLTEPGERSRRAREYFRQVSCATTWAGVESTLQHFEERANLSDSRSGAATDPATRGRC